MAARAGVASFDWTNRTWPYTDVEDHEPARFSLTQVADGSFHLLEPFRYHRASEVITVTPAELGDTDLASIPLFLSWFASRHGRHTPASLVHDTMLHRRRRDRREADAVFLEAMRAADVPPLRAMVMHAAVTMATRWSRGGASRLAMAAWAGLAAAGTGALVYGMVRGERRLIGIGVAGPAVASVLWGRDIRAGLVAGYAMWVVLLPSVTSAVGYGVYSAAERAIQAARVVIPGGEPPPLPPPVPFAER